MRYFFNNLFRLCPVIIVIIGFLPTLGYTQENMDQIVRTILMASPTSATDQIVPTILMASPTSATEQSTSIICLFDKNCEGAWQPQTKDGAVNEGFGFQFEQPFQLDYITITVKGNSEGLTFTAYLDGNDAIADATSEDRDPISFVVQRFEVDFEKAVYVLRREPYRVDGSLKLEYKAKSVFFRITDATSPAKWEVTSIDLVNKNILESFGGPSLVKEIYNEPHALAVNLPIEAPLIEFDATSILEPYSAYHPSHLFDSNTSMAFATDGKKGNGIGTKIALNFKNQQDIAGVMIWNGYQRSDKHFSANSRVKALLLNGEKIAVKDEQAMQKIMLAKPITNSQIVLEIADVYKGQAYRDVVLSELRFIDNKGAIILPISQEMPAATQLTDNAFTDKTFSSFFGDMDWATLGENSLREDYCYVSTFRLRSNGSFVLYPARFKPDSKNRAFATVAEGNFELVKPNEMRLFGKKYQTSFSRSVGYISGKGNDEIAHAAPQIFQNLFKIEKFSNLDESEQKKLLNFLVAMPTYDKEEDEGEDLGLSVLLDDGFVVEAKTIGELREKLRKILLKKDVYAVKSDIYTDLVVPVNRVPFCTKI
ncbi:NADase-type glycan-binding domain-containing protein [Bartonella sp. HY761]|uniref:NADase-type glycan-binding domain-containing protein n=1 Tax=Bartonella sp. HY761 TaxID=2979330 RepID=UPI0021E231AD|nr:hypothetical protein [Bartonella sp. HY761]UXN08019.1 hypothetical protein N6A79_14675 [Bartonella sp. HY761]